jgi:hypothetical protein
VVAVKDIAVAIKNSIIPPIKDLSTKFGKSLEEILKFKFSSLVYVGCKRENKKPLWEEGLKDL